MLRNPTLKKNLLPFCAIVLIGLFAFGCSEEAKTDYSNAGAHLKAAGKDTGMAINSDMRQAGATLQADADAAQKPLSDAAAKVQKALNNDETSVAVKQALIAAKDLQISDLEVDTKDKTVTLRGSVPTEDQNQRAEKLTRTMLGSSYIVEDDLMVKSGD
jgi:hypothetical protein